MSKVVLFIASVHRKRKPRNSSLHLFTFCPRVVRQNLWVGEPVQFDQYVGQGRLVVAVTISVRVLVVLHAAFAPLWPRTYAALDEGAGCVGRHDGLPDERLVVVDPEIPAQLEVRGVGARLVSEVVKLLVRSEPRRLEPRLVVPLLHAHTAGPL